VLGPYTVYLLIAAGSAFFVAILDPIVAVYYVQVVGLSPIELVLLGTIVEGTSFLFQVPTGVVADVYSRRWAVILGYLLTGLCFVIQGLVPILLVIAAAELMRGLGRTFVNGALEAWIADELGERRVAPAFIRASQVKQVAGLVGTGIGAGIATIGLGLPLVVGGVGLLAMVVFLVFAMPETARSRVADGGGERGSWHVMRATARAGARTVRGRPLLLTFLGLWFALAVCTEGLDRLWEAHLLANFTFPTFGGLEPVVWFGAINVAFMLGSLVVAEVVRRRLNTASHVAIARTLFAFSLVRIVGVVLFGLVGSFEIAVAAYITAEVFRQVSGPIFTGWVNRSLDPATRATVLSMGGQVDAFGQLGGGPLVGLVGQLFSLRWAMVAAAATLVPALPLIVRAARQAPRASGETADGVPLPTARAGGVG
jgi:DHA3 family tetracycline resistance protein-like MFS transporter